MTVKEQLMLLTKGYSKSEIDALKEAEKLENQSPKDEPKEEPKDEPKDEPKEEPKDEPKEEPKYEPPAEDPRDNKIKEMEEEIVMLLAGRIAEQIYHGDNFTTGASNDIERATKIARDMVVKYGMSEALGPILYGNANDEVFLGRDYGHVDNVSQEVASKIDAEIKKIIDTAYAYGEELLKTNIDKLHLVAKVLYEKEKIDGDEFVALMQQTKETIEE